MSLILPAPMRVLQPITSGLIGYWPFWEGSGTVVADLTANRNNGTLVNSPMWTSGLFGNGILFSGTTRITVSNPKNLQFYGTLPFSVSVWINAPLSQTGGIIGIDKNQSGHFYGWSLGVTTAGKLNFEYNDSTGTDRATQSVGVLGSGSWHHLGISLSGTGLTFYIDGIGAGTSTLVNQLNNDGVLPLYIGFGDYQGANGYTPETLGQIRLFNTPLTDTDMGEEYYRGARSP
ncbi:MAG TPA: LamG domain-containing protein [Nitrososphaerales archaeon]|nr:LamG domain-containing protein [Nitrososphaerales archaeon]